jgi:hypothetical protein
LVPFVEFGGKLIGHPGSPVYLKLIGSIIASEKNNVTQRYLTAYVKNDRNCK